jgi:predicted O-methyltransferase YrrM
MMLFFFYLRFCFRCLRFYFQAATKYDVHSPFVADFVEYIVEDERVFYAFPFIERMRARLHRNNYPIEIVDLGAGSKANRAKIRSVRNILRYSAVSETTGQQLFRLIAHYKPKQIVELGTSLGMSTMYLAAAAPNGQVTTLEGCPDIADVAQMNFQRLEFSNISLLLGDFQNTFPKVLNEIAQLDFLFIDGDHRAGRAEQYFEWSFTQNPCQIGDCVGGYPLVEGDGAVLGEGTETPAGESCPLICCSSGSCFLMMPFGRSSI